MMDRLPVYLRTRDISKLFRVSIRTVTRRITDGKIPAIKVGQGYRVPRAALMQDVTDIGEVLRSDLERALSQSTLTPTDLRRVLSCSVREYRELELPRELRFGGQVRHTREAIIAWLLTSTQRMTAGQQKSARAGDQIKPLPPSGSEQNTQSLGPV